MSEFKLPVPVSYFAKSTGYNQPFYIFANDGKAPDHAMPLYTHDQLIQALTDLGDDIAECMGEENNKYKLVLKRYVKELLT